MDILLYTAIFFLTSVHLLRFAIYLIASDIRGVEHFKNHMKRKRSRVSYPTLSVVVPTHNDQSTIQTTVMSALVNEYENFEVIVADFGSTDTTRRIVLKIKKENPRARLQLVRYNESVITSQLLNDVLQKHARGSLLMLLDPKTMLANEAISNAVAHFRSDRRLAALITNTKIVDNTSKYGRAAQKFERFIGNRVKESVSLLNVEYNISSINSTFNKSYLKKVGYFDTTQDNNDTERIVQILNQICRYKCRIGYGHDVHTTPYVAPDLRDRVTKRLYYKYGRTEATYKNPVSFISQQPKQSKILNFFKLPYAVYGDILLTMEPLFALFIVLNFFLLLQPAVLFIGILLFTFYVSFILMISNREGLRFTQQLQLLVLAPFSWFIFYIITMLDYRTLILYLRNMRTPARARLYE